MTFSTMQTKAYEKCSFNTPAIKLLVMLRMFNALSIDVDIVFELLVAP